MSTRRDPEEALRRLMLVPRGLVFVFLVYFLPTFLRDLLGQELPGGGFAGALRGDRGSVWMPLAISLATFALSATFVFMYGRSGQGAESPRPLLAFDRRWGSEWARGLLLGGVAATATVLPLVVTGGLEIHGPGAMFAHPAAAGAVFLLLVLEAAREELGFRGPAQRDLSNAIRVLPAAIFLAGSFALIHRDNPDVTRPGFVGIFIAGLALAGIVRARGDVALASGLHAGWNIFLGLGWSVRVSGHPIASAALDVTQHDTPWTGGSFGPEASPTGIAVLTLLAILAWTRPAASSPTNERSNASAPTSDAAR